MTVKARTSYFTIMELVAVITITAILLTVTLRVMRTDSVKSNSISFASAIKYAQTYAISKLSTADEWDGSTNTADGIPDEYIKVVVTHNSRSKEIQIVITKENQSDPSSASAETIFDETLLKGTSLTDPTSDVTTVTFGFRQNGTPWSGTVGTTLTSQLQFKFSDVKVPDNNQTVKIKPFTGKATYY